MNYILIAIGSATGGLLRALISQKLPPIHSFPIATFLVNILGTFLIGLLAGHLLHTNSPLRPLLITGFCGGFTTFSTFSKESYDLIQSGHTPLAILYITSSILSAILALYISRKVI